MKAAAPLRKKPPLPLPRESGEGGAQGMWSGTLGFSLVAIPVRMVKAVEPGRVSFRMLHRADYAPLRRRMFCPRHGKLVPPGEIERGYELAAGTYLPVTGAELESVSPERSRTIEILRFIDPGEIDPVRYDHPYYLLPDKGGEKAYRLLAEVMRRSGRAGLAKFVMGERERLVAVSSEGGALLLCTIHYDEEMLPGDTYAPLPGSADPGEIRRQKAAIGGMMAPFDPARYADRRRGRILDLLKRKMRERGVVQSPVEEQGGEGSPPDLVAALREAMRGAKKKR